MGLLVTSENGDFGAIAVTRGSCAATILKGGESHIGLVLILYRIAFRVGRKSYLFKRELSLKELCHGSPVHFV